MFSLWIEEEGIRFAPRRDLELPPLAVIGLEPIASGDISAAPPDMRLEAAEEILGVDTAAAADEVEEPDDADEDVAGEAHLV